MNVELRDEARDDLVNGAAFYGEQSVGLDEHFLRCLREDIKKLEATGGIHEKYLGFHRSLSDRFPFAIYYFVAEEIVVDPRSLMKQRGLLVVIALVSGVALLLIPAMNAAREATSVMHCSNTMKQISLAIQNYNDTYGHLPPCAIVDSDENAIHSWRAVVTPYMAALPQMYRWDRVR
jgi:nicotinic acid phosphoribosyltransferase